MVHLERTESFKDCKINQEWYSSYALIVYIVKRKLTTYSKILKRGKQFSYTVYVATYEDYVHVLSISADNRLFVLVIF